ncbi:HNH endonuclease [Nonomuraea sp. NPDC050540]|uniref:HNH endonuclease n=1 Tax=Nonomuraea sp. NPDC050540 TaxID=3364367 RepID=UPI0037B5BE20
MSTALPRFDQTCQRSTTCLAGGAPKSKGGSGDPSNGQVLCRVCNRSKSDN